MTKEFTQFELSDDLTANLGNFINLSPCEKLVLVALCRYYPNMYPSQLTISKQLGLPRRTIQRSIEGICNYGYLVKTHSDNHNWYKFTDQFFDCLYRGDDTSQGGRQDVASEATTSRIGGDVMSHKQTNNKLIKNYLTKGKILKKFQKKTPPLDIETFNAQYERIKAEQGYSAAENFKKKYYGLDGPAYRVSDTQNGSAEKYVPPDKSKSCSPLDMPYFEALQWFCNLHDWMLKGKFAVELAKKYPEFLQKRKEFQNGKRKTTETR